MTVGAGEIAAMVLAGGMSSRMGQPKALMPFAGEPLAARIIARLKEQAAIVYLNARDESFATLGAQLVLDDARWRGAGPLAGVAAGLARAMADGFAVLATCPCDAPFLPFDFVARLGLGRAGAGAAVAVSAEGVEPMFALWPVGALGAVEAALASGRASPRALLDELGAARVAFPGASNPFANLNTPQEWAEAEALCAKDLLEAPRPAPTGGSRGERS